MVDLRAVQYIKHGSFKEALRFIGEDQDNTANMMQFWHLRKNALERQDDLEKQVELAVHEWNVFHRLYLQIGLELDYYRAVREWMFTTLKDLARKYLDNTEKTRTIYYLGVSHLMLKEYDEALTWANHAVRKDPEHMGYHAFLANCWECLGHDFQARLLYREAFFQKPEEIELSCMNSQIIDTIIERFLHFQYPVEHIQFWIPVFGRIFGLFNVKRALTTLEYSSLVQRMRSLEGRFFNTNQQEQDPSVLPKLLNSYLWMIDYFDAAGKHEEKVEELESQLLAADRFIHRIYMDHADLTK